MTKGWSSFRKFNTFSQRPNVLICFSEEVEFRWAGNKLFHPGDENKTVGEVYKTYLTGEMAQFYAAPTPGTKKAASAQPQLLMALELYIDQPKVYFFVINKLDSINLTLFYSS